MLEDCRSNRTGHISTCILWPILTSRTGSRKCKGINWNTLTHTEKSFSMTLVFQNRLYQGCRVYLSGLQKANEHFTQCKKHVCDFDNVSILTSFVVPDASSCNDQCLWKTKITKKLTTNLNNNSSHSEKLTKKNQTKGGVGRLLWSDVW